MQVTFDDVLCIALPEGMRSEIADAARSQGQIIAEFVRSALAGAIVAAASPDFDDLRRAECVEENHGNLQRLD